jgi:transposase
MVERNQEQVLNYFVKEHTNALAENINSRIQQFISANKGTRDIDFVYFKIKKMCAENTSGTSK